MRLCPDRTDRIWQGFRQYFANNLVGKEIHNTLNIANKYKIILKRRNLTMALVDICFSCACVENIDRYWKGFKSKSYNSKILKPTENWLDMKKARESETMIYLWMDTIKRLSVILSTRGGHFKWHYYVWDKLMMLFILATEYNERA